MGDRGVIIDVLFFLVCLFALDKVRRNTILLLLGVVGLIVLGGFFSMSHYIPGVLALDPNRKTIEGVVVS